MKLLAFLITTLVCLKVMALPPIGDVEKALNLGDVMSPKNQLGTQIVSNKIQLLKCQWSYARQGGAVSTISLQSVDGAACKLPSKAIVVKTWIDEVTNITAASITTELALSTGQVAGDLKAAVSVGAYSGVMDSLAGNSAASAIKMTAIRTPSLAISGSAVTAGKINVFISYIISD